MFNKVGQKEYSELNESKPNSKCWNGKTLTFNYCKEKTLFESLILAQDKRWRRA